MNHLKVYFNLEFIKFLRAQKRIDKLWESFRLSYKMDIF